MDHRVADHSHSRYRADDHRGARLRGAYGLVPKSIISMYLCFFPVAIGMVKGLTSPDPMQLDLMRTYNASVSRCCGSSVFPLRCRSCLHR